MKQRSRRNPPSTDYQRPTVRRFYIWQDRHIVYERRFAEHRGWGQQPWRWMCTFCDPPSYGFRSRKGAWAAILNTSMPRHFRVKHYHHRRVARGEP